MARLFRVVVHAEQIHPENHRGRPRGLVENASVFVKVADRI